MPFVSLPDVKALLRIPLVDTSRDVELQLYVDAANAHVYSIFGGLTDSVPTSYTDQITIEDGETTAVWTRRWPVLASPAPVVLDSGDVVDPADYRVTDLGLLKLVKRWDRWTYGVDAIQVTYTAGFAAGDPALAELRLAAAQIAVYNANTSSHAGMMRERIGQYEYELGGAAQGGANGPGGFGIPASAERLLANWTAVMRGWPNAT
jgi:hypothetical protein